MTFAIACEAADFVLVNAEPEIGCTVGISSCEWELRGESKTSSPFSASAAWAKRLSPCSTAGPLAGIALICLES